MPRPELRSFLQSDGADHPPPQPPEVPDLPAESYRVRVELWNTAGYYHREDSTKASSNPRSSSSTSSSQRFCPTTNLKSTTTRVHAGHSSRRRNQRPPHVIKLNISARKQQLQIIEPGSPKVSCFGRILPAPPPPSAAAENEDQLTVAGCWTALSSLFSWRRTGGAAEESTEEDSSMQSWEASSRSKSVASGEAPSLAPPPGIGEMKRLASARRAASWSEELVWDLARAGGSMRWSPEERTADGSPDGGGCGRRRRDGWESEGSASV